MALTSKLKNLEARLEQLNLNQQKAETEERLSAYRGDPVRYASNVLKVRWWEKQREIARLLHVPPYRVLAMSAHGVGKTFLAGGLVNYWFDTHVPSVILTTAPTAREVRHLLWKEIRSQRLPRGGFRGESNPLLYAAYNHFAVGFTAKKGESMQGRHEPSMLFAMDEAVGIESTFFETTKSMFQRDGTHAWICTFNPTDITAQVYQEFLSGDWHVVSMSALDHPNILAALRNEKSPYPGAVSLSQVEASMKEHCEKLHPDDEPEAYDFEFPPGSGFYFRPDPVFESRWLGRWPTSPVDSIWYQALWDQVIRPQPVRDDTPYYDDLQIGCDVARFGSDRTVFHIRFRSHSIHHEVASGWSTDRIAGRLKQLCHEFGSKYGVNPFEVLVAVDDVGVGGGVVDQRDDYRFDGINAARVARRPDLYESTRSELWFCAREHARYGLLNLCRLESGAKSRLQSQLMAPTYKVDSRGRRVVEPKAKTKERVGGLSPDDADAMNLAYYTPSGGVFEVVYPDDLDQVSMDPKDRVDHSVHHRSIDEATGAVREDQESDVYQWANDLVYGNTPFERHLDRRNR